MRNILEKIDRDARTVIAVFLAGAGIVLWMNAKISEPILHLQADFRLMQKDIATMAEAQKTQTEREQKQDMTISDVVIRVVKLER